MRTNITPTTSRLSPGELYIAVAPVLWKTTTASEYPAVICHLETDSVLLYIGIIDDHLYFISKYGMICTFYLEESFIVKASA